MGEMSCSRKMRKICLGTHRWVLACSYCFAVLGSSFFMNAYLSINVALARKKYNITYPALYAPTGHKDEVAFNSVQRAHQNTLESYSMVMLQMMCAGLKYPVTSAACGATWVLGRVIYGYGKRVRARAQEKICSCCKKWALLSSPIHCTCPISQATPRAVQMGAWRVLSSRIWATSLWSSSA